MFLDPVHAQGVPAMARRSPPPLRSSDQPPEGSERLSLIASGLLRAMAYSGFRIAHHLSAEAFLGRPVAFTLSLSAASPHHRELWGPLT